VIQGLDVGGGTAYRIWFNLGDQRYAPSLTVEPEGAFDLTDPAVQIADFNGDRVPDIIRLLSEQIEVKAGLGYGRFMDTRTVGLPDLTLTIEQIQKAKWTDLTGDGIDDLVLEQAAPGQLWYWVNLGNYQLSLRKGIEQMPQVAGQNPVIRWADMNGNGTTDLVYADATSEPRMQTVDLGEIINCGTTPHLLTSIANGLGLLEYVEVSSRIQSRGGCLRNDPGAQARFSVGRILRIGMEVQSRLPRHPERLRRRAHAEERSHLRFRRRLGVQSSLHQERRNLHASPAIITRGCGCRSTADLPSKGAFPGEPALAVR
jgi:hypothetical protein